MRLSSCSSCDAFVPPIATSCPHCAAPYARATKPKGPLRGLMAIGAGGLLSMTLSACYGAVVDPEFDSGPFPPRDSGSDSGLVVDSGGPIDSGLTDDAGADDAGADDAGADGGAGDGGADDAGADGGAGDGGADDAGAGDDAGA